MKYYIKNQYNHIPTARRTNILWGIENGMEVGDIFGTKLTKCRFEEIDRTNGFAIVLVTFSYHGKKVTDREIIMFSQTREFSSLAIQKFEAAVKQVEEATNEATHIMVANLPPMTGVIVKPYETTKEASPEATAAMATSVETASVATTAPTQMPFHPLQDDAMFNKQIYNLFAKHHINVTSITKQDGPWYMDNPWQIDTDRGSFLLNRVEGDYDNWGITPITPVTVAVQTEEEVEVETAPVQPVETDKPVIYNANYKVRMDAGSNHVTVTTDNFKQAVSLFNQQGFVIKHTRMYKINGQDFWAIYNHEEKTAMDLTGFIIRQGGNNTWMLDQHNLDNLRYLIGEVDMFYADPVETAPVQPVAVQPAAVDFRTMVEGKTVKIRVNGKVYAGRVVGFKLDFPKVWVREIHTEIEFSRNAILRAVEGDRILEGGSETSVQPVETTPVETPVQPVAMATECTLKTTPVAKPNPVMTNAIAQEVSTSLQPAVSQPSVSMKRLTNTYYYSPSKMVTNKKFDLEEAPGEFLAEVRDYFGEGAYRVKYIAPVITDIGKDYDGDDDFYQVLVVCISGDQFMMTKPKWQTNWQVMPFHGEVKVGDYLLDTPVETATQDEMEVDNSYSPVAIPVTDNEWAEDFLSEMESSSLTRVRIWVLLYRAGLRDYRVSKRRPEQLSLSDLVNLGELETNLIISPEGDEVWDAGWECWRERTQEFITSVKAKTEATDIELRYADSKRGDVQCLFLSSSVEEDRQAVIMMLQNGFIDGWDTLHYHLNTYRMLSNPYELNGFGAALVTSATGTCHRVPFVITYGGLPFNQQAIDEYHNFLSRNW